MGCGTGSSHEDLAKMISLGNAALGITEGNINDSVGEVIYRRSILKAEILLGVRYHLSLKDWLVMTSEGPAFFSGISEDKERILFAFLDDGELCQRYYDRNDINYDSQRGLVLGGQPSARIIGEGVKMSVQGGLYKL